VRVWPAVRELWTVRDQIARRRDTRPRSHPARLGHRRRPLADPKTAEELTKLPNFRRQQAAAQRHVWLAALEARAQPERRTPLSRKERPAPAVRWSQTQAEAARAWMPPRAALPNCRRGQRARENMVSPELVRPLCWDMAGQRRCGRCRQQFPEPDARQRW